MKRDKQSLLEDVLALPQAARSEIAGRLLESLEPATEFGVEEAWRKEVAARVTSLDAGEVETIPWEEVRNRLFEKLGERRSA